MMLYIKKVRLKAIAMVTIVAIIAMISPCPLGSFGWILVFFLAFTIHQRAVIAV